MPAVAPPAPGRLGVPLLAPDAQRFLGMLDDWVRMRRDELDQLDAAVLRSPERDQLTHDMMLALTLWKAVSDRLQLMLTTWDSGRVGERELTRLSSLVWGRLDETVDATRPGAHPGPGPEAPRAVEPAAPRSPEAGTSSVAVSVPEACRLCDAMTSALRTRLAIDPAVERFAHRLTDLRAQLERLRDQVGLESPDSREEAAAQLVHLERRVLELAERTSRGGDIGGLIGPVEIDAARLERDLIVNGARRRQTRAQAEQVAELRTQLTLRSEALQQLVDDCVARLAPAPRYAVPQVTSLGEVPTDPQRLSEFGERLEQVGRAMQVVQDSYAQALAELEDLRKRAERAGTRAETAGIAEQQDVRAIRATTDAVLGRTPVPVLVATELVGALEVAVRWYIDSAGDESRR